MVDRREFILALPHGKTLSLRPPASVMGALDISLKSPFSAAQAAAFAVERASSLLADGATILNIADEREAAPLAAEDALSSLATVISALSAAVAAPICVQTANARIAAAAIERGASMMNDVWGLQHDSEMARIAARTGAGVILSHNRAAIDPDLDIVADIIAFLSRSIDSALSVGVDRRQLIVDPGLGCGKTAFQDLDCVRRLNELSVLDCPILLGPASAKTVEAAIGRKTPSPAAAVAMAVAGVMNGAVILRTHDVAAQATALQVMRVAQPESRSLARFF
jgi:dihydropteroate synthase